MGCFPPLCNSTELWQKLSARQDRQQGVEHLAPALSLGSYEQSPVLRPRHRGLARPSRRLDTDRLDDAAGLTVGGTIRDPGFC
jgi:hypothetical protein